MGAGATGEGAPDRMAEVQGETDSDGFFGLRQSELDFCLSATRSPDS